MPEFIRGLHNIGPEHHGNVVTIGAFDGVHLGHQAIIRQVLDESQRRQYPSLVLLFEPQPNEYFNKALAPARLMRLRDKLLSLYLLGVDRVCCLSFNQALRRLTADEFIDEILIDALGTQYLVVGDDFRFGLNREGDYQRLTEEAFDVDDTPSIIVDNERVSSTRIRKALAESDFFLATRLLGKPFTINGQVVKGDQIGRTIGVPTANIDLHRLHSPLKGVFAVEAITNVGSRYSAVANIGTRPTVANRPRLILEVHLLDFEGDLYGQRLSVNFYHKLRDEQAFDGLAKLKEQLEHDIQQAKAYFQDHHRLIHTDND